MLTTSVISCASDTDTDMLDKVKSFFDISMKSILDIKKTQNFNEILSIIHQKKYAWEQELTKITNRVESFENEPMLGYFAYKTGRYLGLKEYNPVLVMYRHDVDPESLTGITGLPLTVFAMTKANRAVKTEKGEPSGAVFWYHGKTPQEADELVFSFSGSNSTKDWISNFSPKSPDLSWSDLFGGISQSRYLGGLTGHPGLFLLMHHSLASFETQLNDFLQFYVEEAKRTSSNTVQKRTLKLVTTGHSLGGGLAELMGYYLATTVIPYLNKELPYHEIDLKIYTYAAPAILDAKSAKTFQDLIGKENIMRVWNVGDPVPFISENVLHK